MGLTTVDQDLNYTCCLFIYANLKNKHLIAILKHFPKEDLLRHTEYSDLVKMGLPIRDAQTLLRLLQSDQWQGYLEQTSQHILQHIELGIEMIAFQDDRYPVYLRRIQDPPPILYAKGNLAALGEHKTIAIVGTREPTETGKRVAKSITHYFCESKYVIVSGLASGIDTVAHQEALECHSMTIAVLAGSLEKIYPKENSSLAKQIVESNGLLLSEIAVHAKFFKSAFVRRDRLQSGLSLAVIPIQTSIDGGTMHTAKYARDQNRLLYCPRPLGDEAHTPVYSGIWDLLDKKHASPIHSKEEYPNMLPALKAKEAELLDEQQTNMPPGLWGSS